MPQVALLLPDGAVAEVVEVAEATLSRMVRRAQVDALRAGLDDPSRGEIGLLGQRGAPGLARAVQVRLFGQEGRIYEREVPIYTLEPLISPLVARVRAAAGLPAGTMIRYCVLREEGIAWSHTLVPFVTVPTARNTPPDGEALFPAFESPDDVPILAGEGALAAMADHCRDSVVERGGVLLGYVRHTLGTGLWVEVLAFAPAEGAAEEQLHLRFTARAWEAIQCFKVAAEREHGLEHPLQCVGWVHGHPRLEEMDNNPHFLSSQDIATTAQHFADPFACAIVVDAEASPETPLAERIAVYGWDEAGIALVRRSLSICQP